MPADDYCADAGQFDAAGWVVGALDPGDAERFAEHLLACRECQLTVAELELAGRMLLISPAAQPPVGLEAATLARVRKAAGPPRPSPG
jgi:anti-sigma factor RsiW